MCNKKFQFLLLYLLGISLKISISDNNFVLNSAVGRSIQDKITFAEYLVSNIVKVAYMKARNGYVDIADPKSAMILFLSEKICFSSVLSKIFVSLENGVFYDYSTDYSMPSNTSFGKVTAISNSLYIYQKYSISEDDVEIKFSGNMSFNIRENEWYISAERRLSPFWTQPYISSTTGEPIISYIYPLVDFSVNGVRLPFAGCVGADVPMSYFSLLLLDIQPKNYFISFIVDSSLNVIGSSFQNESVDKGLQNAATSKNTLIASATALLKRKAWITELIVLNGMYMQCFPYKDKITGSSWYIVVLQPAILDADHLGPEDPARYISAIVFSTIGLLIAIVCALLTLIFWKTKMMKMTQPIFVILIAIGCIFLCLASFSLLGENTLLLCTSRVFSFNLTFTMAFAPLVIKCRRVHLLFNVNPLAKKEAVGNLSIIGQVLLFVAIDGFIVLITVYVGGRGAAPYDITVVSNNAFVQQTQCGYYENYRLIAAEVVFKGFMVIAACFLSFKNRNVVNEIGGSRATLAIVYNTAVAALITITINRSMSDIRNVVLGRAIGIAFCTSFACIALVAPVMYQILVVGDHEAAEGVLEEMLNSPASRQSLSRQTRYKTPRRNAIDMEGVPATPRAGLGSHLTTKKVVVLDEKVNDDDKEDVTRTFRHQRAPVDVLVDFKVMVPSAANTPRQTNQELDVNHSVQ